MTLPKRLRRLLPSLALALVLLALPLLSGCGTFLSLLKINPDGSGTIVQTTKLNAMAASFMNSMSSAGDSTSQGGSASKPDMFSEEQVRKQADKLGEGVRFVRMKRLDAGGGNGYRAVYAFDDVRDVRLSLDDQMDLDSGDDADAESDDDADSSQPVTFDFEAGAPATLTMHLGNANDMENSSDMSGSDTDSSDVAQQMQMMRMLFQDAKMRLAVEPQGTLVSTDATYSDDSRVTLMEMDFNKMMADQQAFKTFMQAQSKDLSEAEKKQMMKEMPGVRVESSKTVSMQFR